VDALGLSTYDAGVLAADPDATALFERTLAAGDRSITPKAVANWVTGEYLRLRKLGGEVVVDPDQLAELIRVVEDGSISRANAKEVFEAHAAGGEAVAAIIEARGFRQISDSTALGPIIDAVLAANPKAVADYRGGTTGVIGFLVGQVMKATRGQANAALVQTAVRDRLEADE
jgi:aspartyl-tRNA(Asn)/glutamyl-tRNA(Gln) amidotransferase subunit B